MPPFLKKGLVCSCNTKEEDEEDEEEDDDEEEGEGEGEGEGEEDDEGEEESQMPNRSASYIKPNNKLRSGREGLKRAKSQIELLLYSSGYIAPLVACRKPWWQGTFLPSSYIYPPFSHQCCKTLIIHNNIHTYVLRGEPLYGFASMAAAWTDRLEINEQLNEC